MDNPNLIEDIYWEMDWSGFNEDGTRKYPDMPEKEMVFEKSKALAWLLNNEIVFLNNHWWMKDWPEEARKRTSINVNCNDVFMWACAEAEPLNYEDIQDLYDHVVKDPCWGSAVWCIKKRNMMPQRPVRKAIEKAGIWDLSSMNLKDNPDS